MEEAMTPLQKSLSAIRERQSKATEPKLCPFCGHKAILETASAYWVVECISCGARVGYEKERGEAVQTWNTRAEDALLTRLIAACEIMTEALAQIDSCNFHQNMVSPATAEEALAKATAILEGSE